MLQRYIVNKNHQVIVSHKRSSLYQNAINFNQRAALKAASIHGMPREANSNHNEKNSSENRRKEEKTNILTLINKLGSRRTAESLGEILNNLPRITASQRWKVHWNERLERPIWPFRIFPFSFKLPTHNLFLPLMRYARCSIISTSLSAPRLFPSNERLCC